MSTASPDTAAPLDELMLAMDVVDTLRHRQGLVERQLAVGDRETALIAKLREIYRDQGIEVPDRILKQGVDALAESRFVYEPPKRGVGRFMARLYVRRSSWGPWFLGVFAAALIAFSGYQYAYLPYQAGQAEAARIELAETIPASLDTIFQSITKEADEAVLVRRAEAIRTRGLSAAREQDLAGAEQALTELRALRETMRQEYTLRIVNREGVRSGVWTFPEVNTDATNYYLIVEAIDRDGNALRLPVEHEETGERETVSMWGIRVPEGTYRTVEADKRDNGLIERDTVGFKQAGHLELNYVLDTLDGTITRW